MAETVKSRQKKFLRELNQVILDRTAAFEAKLDKIVKLILGFKSDSLKIKIANTKELSGAEKINPKEDTHFKEDLAAFRKNISSQIGQDAEAHFDLGIAYKEMGLLEEAITSFKAAQKAGKDESSCSQMISLVYEELGDIKNALNYAKVALELGRNLSPRNKDWLRQMRERINELKAKLK